jgi:hypothetical protein
MKQVKMSLVRSKLAPVLRWLVQDLYVVGSALENGMLRERGLGLVVHLPLGCVAKIDIP